MNIQGIIRGVSQTAYNFEERVRTPVNVLGSIVVIGSVIGAFRTVISTIMTIVFAILESIEKLVKSKNVVIDSADFFDSNDFYFTKLSLKHLGLGLAELVPGVGFVVHRKLNALYQNSGNSFNRSLAYK